MSNSHHQPLDLYFASGGRGDYCRFFEWRTGRWPCCGGSLLAVSGIKAAAGGGCVGAITRGSSGKAFAARFAVPFVVRDRLSREFVVPQFFLQELQQQCLQHSSFGELAADCPLGMPFQ